MKQVFLSDCTAGAISKHVEEKRKEEEQAERFPLLKSTIKQ